ncbi:hypothetical protein M0805_000157 [Coniferiporia weirii]|nr:hypothetical protein M0805_000157 [Coniferiporia weirii]
MSFLKLFLPLVSATFSFQALTTNGLYTGASGNPGLQGASQKDWDNLKTEVEGRLILGRPVAKPCFTNSNSTIPDVFDSKACQDVRVNYINETFRSNAPGGYINTQWETCQKTSKQCLLDFSNTSNIAAVTPPRQCALGSIPDYFIDVVKPSDVSAAFSFSRKSGVRVIVKNTGHDYKGRSSAPGSLALWTHNLKNMTFEPSFVPEGCSDSYTAVTLGAGVQFRDVYAFAEANNFTFVGGSDPGVGPTGGWLQGGGHGALTNTMGMGVDRVLQFKIVTPDGKYRVANACQNKDLFFALRGGGGGTFGVVLEATTLVSPPVTLQVAAVIFTQENETLTKSLWSVVVENSLRWAEEGWGAFVTSDSALFVTPALNNSAANVSMLPLLELGNSFKTAGVEGVEVVFSEFPSWGEFFNTFAGTGSAEIGANLALASRLLPKSNFETAASREELLNALLTAESLTPGVRFLGSTPINFRGDGGTSITEAWRDSVYHITLIAPWNFNSTLASRREQYSTASQSIDLLRRLTPDAAYSNEADVHEPNHEVAFWGTNYEELLKLKNKFDPDRLLDCWHCVGWQPESSQFSCYI